jgi:hypothetical protein
MHRSTTNDVEATREPLDLFAVVESPVALPEPTRLSR